MPQTLSMVCLVLASDLALESPPLLTDLCDHAE